MRNAVPELYLSHGYCTNSRNGGLGFAGTLSILRSTRANCQQRKYYIARERGNSERCAIEYLTFENSLYCIMKKTNFSLIFRDLCRFLHRKINWIGFSLFNFFFSSAYGFELYVDAFISLILFVGVYRFFSLCRYSYLCKWTRIRIVD